MNMPYNLINVPAILSHAFVMEVALYFIHFILPLLTHSYAAARPRSEGKKVAAAERFYRKGGRIQEVILELRENAKQNLEMDGI